jgi:adenylate cyclase, class 2
VPLELEVKIHVADASMVRARVAELAGAAVQHVLELNTFFDSSDGRLRAADCGLRVRTSRLVETGQVTGSILTFKGPRLPGPIKRREEIEFGVSDANTLQLLLEQLGYTPCLSFEKRRETWRLDGCEVVIDELPHLGYFLEVEGDSQGRVLGVLERLGLSDEPLIRDGYPQLIAEYLRLHPDAGMRF